MTVDVEINPIGLHKFQSWESEFILLIDHNGTLVEQTIYKQEDDA
jgi:hypothetical protein